MERGDRSKRRGKDKCTRRPGNVHRRADPRPRHGGRVAARTCTNSPTSGWTLRERWVLAGSREKDQGVEREVGYAEEPPVSPTVSGRPRSGGKERASSWGPWTGAPRVPDERAYPRNAPTIRTWTPRRAELRTRGYEQHENRPARRPGRERRTPRRQSSDAIPPRPCPLPFWPEAAAPNWPPRTPACSSRSPTAGVPRPRMRAWAESTIDGPIGAGGGSCARTRFATTPLPDSPAPVRSPQPVWREGQAGGSMCVLGAPRKGPGDRSSPFLLPGTNVPASPVAAPPGLPARRGPGLIRRRLHSDPPNP